MLRRFLVLVVLSFWQGGFVFYAAVVVPVGMSVLRPPSLQSFVTLQVTRYLNFAGAVALLVLGLEILLTSDPENRRTRLRFLLWIFMLLTLAALFVLHPKLESWMDSEAQVLRDREALYPLHRLYLVTSTVQWLCAALFMVFTLRAWREEDRKK